MAQANYKYQGKSNASLKPKTTHEKDTAKRPMPEILTFYP
jgi:hypothetical protein